jgi:hypothetical protein
MSLSSTRHDRDDTEFLRLAATRLILPGASIQERRLVPDEGYSLEQDGEQGVIFLKTGGVGTTTISCQCGLEGGGCKAIVVGEGDIGEYGACVPDSGCGSSGLFCFMSLDFGGGLAVQIKV